MSRLKNQAKKLSQISKKYGYNIKHTHALEIISQLEGDSNRHVKLSKSTEASELLDENFQRGLLKMFLDDENILKKAVLSDNSLKTVKMCLNKNRYSIFLVAKKLIKNETFSLEELRKILSSSKKNENIMIELDKVLKLEIINDKVYQEFFDSLSQQRLITNLILE